MKSNICKHCGIEFISNIRNKNYCSEECRKAKKREYDKAYFLTPGGKEVREKSALKNKEKKLAYDKIYFSTQKGKEVKRNSKIRRKAHISEQTTLYQARPEVHERRMTWSRTFKHTEKGRINARYYGNKRRGWKLKTITGYTKQEFLEKLKATNSTCPMCNTQFTSGYHSKHELTIDHNPPISKAPKGFVYTIDTISLLCRSCNAKKGNRNIEWIMAHFKK